MRNLSTVLDNTILIFQAFAAYRNNALKMREEHQKLKVEHDKLKDQLLQQQDTQTSDLQTEFDKILEEKRAKFEHLVDMYNNACSERDGLNERIQTIISAPEYKSFRERERREGNERAKKDKEAWNNIDDTDDEFSAFGVFPERKRTITDYEDNRLG